MQELKEKAILNSREEAILQELKNNIPCEKICRIDSH